MTRIQRFLYWLGSPRGALIYFGTGYTLLALAICYWRLL